MYEEKNTTPPLKIMVESDNVKPAIRNIVYKSVDLNSARMVACINVLSC